MKSEFKEYRDVYLKLKKNFESLEDYGNFHFSYDATNKSVETNASPDSKEYSQYLTVLKVFYQEDSRLFYQNILSLIENKYDKIIDKKSIEQIKQEISTNDSFKSLKPTDKLDSKEFFTQALIAYPHDSLNHFSEDYAELIKKPVIGQLLWYEFYTFSIGLFIILQNIYQLIIQIDKSFDSNSDQQDDICVICMHSNGTFSSIEHIFPEALGNTELILDKGLVCDTCNNKTLSQLDEDLINFTPIAFLRVQFVPFTKGGKHPSAKFQNVDIKKTRANRIDIHAKDKSAKFSKKQIDGDLYEFKFSLAGSRFDDKNLIRSLMKIAYEATVREKGREFATQARYEDARNLILGKIQPYNSLILSTNSKPSNRLQYSLNFGEIGIVIFISIVGMLFIFNLEKEPVLELADEMKQDGFQIFTF